MFQEQTLAAFTTALASKAAVPGGGGGSALAAALGIALGEMVGSLTVGKKKYAAVEEDLLTLMEEGQTLRQAFLEQIDADAEAFAPLSRAYGIPKDAPGRARELEKCLDIAAQAPLACMRLACRAVEVLVEFARLGSPLVVSDAGTGAALMEAAIKGAALNVKVNTHSMADRERAKKINDEVDSLLGKYTEQASKLYRQVMGRFQ